MENPRATEQEQELAQTPRQDEEEEMRGTGSTADDEHATGPDDR